MTSLENRLELLERLGAYMLSGDEEWVEAQRNAELANPWFTPDNIKLSVENIAREFLAKDKLEAWVAAYPQPAKSKKLGIVMAGNIPLVGFHDFLCGLVCGHELHLKLSSKDEVLIRFLISKLTEWEPAIAEQIKIGDILRGCDAYIATGSNNTARYFEQYFGKYENIIRRNRTSVAVLDGSETDEDIKKLGKDIFSYYGLGCRNVTQVYLPKGYDPKKLLAPLSIYEDIINHHKYKNNYDYQLAIYLLNQVPYVTNDSLLMVENAIHFSAVSVLHYSFYDNKDQLMEQLGADEDIQCVVGRGAVPFGQAQQPELSDYADKTDVMAFLTS